MTLILNTTDLMGKDWRFLEDRWTRERDRWRFFYGLPRNAIEERIRRPNLARYRGAWETIAAARAAGKDAVIVTHLPSVAAPTNALRKARCAHIPQIGFAFNFTAMPTGTRLNLLRKALRGISEFTVYSKAERALYPEYFDLDPARFHFLHWAMHPPQVATTAPVRFSQPYICAIGGEGRDYRVFAEAMRLLPGIPAVVVARPYSISGISFPDNVRVFQNLPSDQTWAIAKHSAGLVIPLLSDETNCGHVTLVAAQRLGIPLVVTQSSGVADYVSDDDALLVRPRKAKDLVRAMQHIVEDRDATQVRSQTAWARANLNSDPQNWVSYMEQAIDRVRADPA